LSGHPLPECPFAPSFPLLKEKPTKAGCALDCVKPELCPLNHLGTGKTGRVKRLASTPELNRRLREMGLFEDQRVKLLGRPSNIICQVCNARLAISDELAGEILVEPLPPQRKTVAS
jgi:ferrous iron transport protein A